MNSSDNRVSTLTSFNRYNFRLGVLPDGELAISLTYCQQAAVWGYAQRQNRARVLGSMGHLEGVQVIYLHRRGYERSYDPVM